MPHVPTRSARPLRRALPPLAAALCGLIAVPASAAPRGPLPPVPANGEMGFIVDSFTIAIHQGKDDCPDGLAGTVRENYLQTLPSTERARLSQAASEPELTQRWKAWLRGPDNTNICANPELFRRGMQATIKGRVARGLDLDDGGNGCAHETFAGPDGERGIDNQSYRAMGCTRNYRGTDGLGGDAIKGFNVPLATGEQSIVLLLRGVNDLRDDPEVEVILATTDDRPVLDTRRNFITGASFTVSDNPRWRNVLRGRIKDGVLTTESHDVRLTRRLGHGGVRGKQAEWDVRRARLRLAFQPDGSLKGLFGGYQAPRNVMVSALLGGIGAADTAGIDCAAQLTTLNALADGDRDPKTGQCTTVSMANDMSAVPAFVVDRPPARTPNPAAVASR